MSLLRFVPKLPFWLFHNVYYYTWKGVPEYLNLQQSSQGTKAAAHLPLTGSTNTPTATKSTSPLAQAPSPAAASLPSLSPITNHPKRLRSSKCREEWTLPTKAVSALKATSIRDPQLSALSENEAVPLPQLVVERWSQFPLSVRVIKGLLEEQLSSKSILDIHFLKKTKVSKNACYMYSWDVYT